MHQAVLVVEDDAAIRELLRLALEDRSYRAIVAEDGLEALERLDQDLPSLILLDFMMPRMDGAALLAELEARGLRPGIPVIVLSATDRGDRGGAGIRAEGYIAKPFELSALLDEVDRVMAGETLALAS